MDLQRRTFRLADLPWGARLGLAFLVLTLLGGLAASMQHLVFHHQNRDEQPGVSVEDIQGAYHGVKTTAPLRGALERNHPPAMSEADRDVLVKWIASDRISEDYDNLDLGDAAPNELIARNCLSCHGRSAADPIAKTVPLEFFDDIKKVAFSREVSPVDIKILAASTHTHALSLGMLTIVVSALLLLTGLPRRLSGLAIFIAGFMLLADLAAWWIARDYADVVYIVIGAGAAYNATTAIMLVAVLVELLLGGRAKG
ncbi:MAG: hypothetical protein H7Y88_09620 [Phycisphaerales bacterium]|nr:hypothetical protein [Phycisphaerales bacterium]